MQTDIYTENKQNIKSIIFMTKIILMIVIILLSLNVLLIIFSTPKLISTIFSNNLNGKIKFGQGSYEIGEDAMPFNK